MEMGKRSYIEIAAGGQKFTGRRDREFTPSKGVRVEIAGLDENGIPSVLEGIVIRIFEE